MVDKSRRNPQISYQKLNAQGNKRLGGVAYRIDRGKSCSLHFSE